MNVGIWCVDLDNSWLQRVFQVQFRKLLHGSDTHTENHQWFELNLEDSRASEMAIMIYVSCIPLFPSIPVKLTSHFCDLSFLLMPFPTKFLTNVMCRLQAKEASSLRAPPENWCWRQLWHTKGPHGSHGTTDLGVSYQPTNHWGCKGVPKCDLHRLYRTIPYPSNAGKKAKRCVARPSRIDELWYLLIVWALWVFMGLPMSFGICHWRCPLVSSQWTLAHDLPIFHRKMWQTCHWDPVAAPVLGSKDFARVRKSKISHFGMRTI